MRHIKNKVLIMKAVSFGILIDKMNVNSVVFLIQEEARKVGIDVFNYEFKRKHLYPFSDELEKDIIQLKEEGYFSETKDAYIVTEKAKEYMVNNQRKYFNYDIDTFIKYHLYINKDKTIFKLTEKLNNEYNILRVEENSIITNVVQDNVYKPASNYKNYEEMERTNRIKKRVLLENDDIIMEKIEKLKKTTK